MANGAAQSVQPSEVAYYFADRGETGNELQIKALKAVVLESHITMLQEQLRISQKREQYSATKVKSYGTLRTDWESALRALKTATAELLVEIQDEIENLEYEVTSCSRIINDEIWRKRVGAGLEAEECVLEGESRMSQDQRYTEKLHKLYKRMDRHDRVSSLFRSDDTDKTGRNGSGHRGAGKEEESECKKILRLLTVTDIKDYVTKSFDTLKFDVQASIGPVSRGRSDSMERETLRARIDKVNLRAAVLGGDYSMEIMKAIDKQEEVLVRLAAEWAESLLRSLK